LCADPLVFIGLDPKQGFKDAKECERQKLPKSPWEPSVRSYHAKQRGAWKDKILLSLVDRLKSKDAKLNAQSEAHKAEVEDLQKKLAEANENFELAKAKQEISEWTSARLEKNVEELRMSKERCYEKSLDCAKKLKDSFAKVGVYSSEEKFIWGDPKGVIEWISEEGEAFEEILSDRGDFCAFAGARGVAAILEKTGCEHVKAATQAEAFFCIDNTKEPSAEATLIGGKFYSDVWMKGGREIADEAIKKWKRIPWCPRRSQASQRGCWARKAYRYCYWILASVFVFAFGLTTCSLLQLNFHRHLSHMTPRTIRPWRQH
jgi:hypothetical protein